jgi:PBP1b-binding outer membrane lipoprotein LpoB
MGLKMRKLLTVTTLTLTVILTGCVSEEYTTIEEAEELGLTYIKAVCDPMLNDDYITQEHIDNLRLVAGILVDTPPVENDYGNGWLKFNEMSNSLNIRADSFTVGTPNPQSEKEEWKTKCDFIYSTFVESFKDW